MRATAIASAALAAWCAWPMAATDRLRPRHSAATEPGSQQRPRSRRFRRRPQRSVGELPLALDLMALCAGAGLPPQDAMAVVGRALPGDLGAVFRAAAGSLMIGAPSDQVWSPALADWPELRRMAEAMSHTECHGTELAPALESIAADQRRLLRVARTRAARRVGVLAAAPLGVCFLPAFVLIGVVPLVAGLLRQLPAF